MVPQPSAAGVEVVFDMTSAALPALGAPLPASGASKKKKKNMFLDFLRQLRTAISHIVDPHHAPMTGPAPGSPEHEEEQYNQLRAVAQLRDGGPIVSFAEYKRGKAGHKSHEMRLEKVRLTDTNGLIGKTHRNPVTGQVYLKEVESFRNFSLLDTWKRDHIVAHPDDHCMDTHLFVGKSLNYRTWIYHSKFRIASETFQIGGNAEAHLWEALAERCVDVNIPMGLWSPAMVYIPLCPFSLLADDQDLMIFTAVVAVFSLLLSQWTNDHIYYWYARLMQLPARLAYLIFTLARIQGGSIQMVGYLGCVFACLYDIFRGDVVMLGAMGHQAHYEVVKSLPNQVFVCLRQGNTERLMSGCGRVTGLPENLTGLKDPGDGSLCLLANVQGLLIELTPLDPLDREIFKEEHYQRGMDASQGFVKYYGLNILHEHAKTVDDLEKQKHAADPMLMLKKPAPKRVGGTVSGDMKVEDMP